MPDSFSRRQFRKTDAVLVVVLLLTALGAACFFWLHSRRSGDRIAVITVGGEVQREINLSRNQKSETFSFPVSGGHTVTFTLEGGRIRFADAQCPDKICQNTGWVENPGDAAICLPFETILRVYAASEWKK